MDLTSFSYLYSNDPSPSCQEKTEKRIFSGGFLDPLEPYLSDHGTNNLTTMIRTIRINNLLIQTFPIRSE
jgi:hypothetical protein